MTTQKHPGASVTCVSDSGVVCRGESALLAVAGVRIGGAADHLQYAGARV